MGEQRAGMAETLIKLMNANKNIKDGKKAKRRREDTRKNPLRYSRIKSEGIVCGAKHTESNCRDTR